MEINIGIQITNTRVYSKIYSFSDVDFFMSIHFSSFFLACARALDWGDASDLPTLMCPDLNHNDIK